MAEIKIDLGLGEPINKVLEMVEKATGVLVAPWSLPRVAAAEAEAMRIKAAAEADAAITRARVELELADLAGRAEYRQRVLGIKRQANLEAIAQGAVLQLQAGPPTKSVAQLPAGSDKNKFDPDWASSFMDSAQDVSNEKMQSLWSRILAGEISQPGSYSRRTLAAVRVMSTWDAEIFTKLRAFLWSINRAPLLLQNANAEEILHQGGIKHGQLAVMRSNGFMMAEGGVDTKSYTFYPERDYFFEYFGSTLTVRTPIKRSIPVLPLTPVGMELARIAGGSRNEDFYKVSVQYFRDAGLELVGLPQ